MRKLLMVVSLLLAGILLVACSKPAATSTTTVSKPSSTQTSTASASPSSTTSTQSTTSSKPLTTVVIASIEHKTGTLAAYGTDQGPAVDIAVNELNADPTFANAGYKFQAIHYDDASSQDQDALLQTKAATQDNATLLVGPVVSTSLLSMVPSNIQLKIPWIVANPVDKITQLNDPYVFRFYGTGTSAGISALKYVLQNVVPQGNIGVLYSNNDHGIAGNQRVNDVAKQLGRTVAVSEAFQLDATDFTPQLLKLKAANVQLVELLQYTVESSVAIAKQAKDLGFNPVWDDSDGLNFQLMTLGKDLVNGWLGWTTFLASNPDPVVQNFLTKFRASTGRDPSPIVLGFYDGIKAAANVILKAGTDREKVRAGLESITGYKGAGGTYSFTAQEHTGLAGAYVVRINIAKNTLDLVAETH